MTDLYPAEEYPAERYEQKAASFYRTGDTLEAFGQPVSLDETRDAAKLVFGSIFEGTAGASSLPQGILDTLLGNVTGLIPGLDDWLDGLPALVGEALENLQQIVNQIMDILNGLIVTPINAAISGVKDWFNDLLGFQSTTTANVDAALTAAEQAQTSVENVSASIVTVVDTINSVSANPFWVSPNPFEDPSFPVNDLKPWIIPPTRTEIGDGAGDIGLPGEDHRHDLVSVTQQPLMTATSGRLYLVPIRCAQDRLYSTEGFVTDGTTAMTSFFAGIYTFDATTGDATRVWDFGNVKGNLLAGSTMKHQRVVTTEDLGAQKGQNYYAGFLSVGGTPPKLGAIPAAIIDRADALHPKAQTLYVDGQTSMPASIAGSAVQANLGYQLWACLGQALVAYDPGAQFIYSDTFNRADGTGYGSSYLLRGPSQGIVGGKASSIGGSDGYRGALRITPTNTDKQRVSMILGSDAALSTRLYLRARSDYSSWACAEISDSGKRIRTGTSFGAGTQRVEDSTTPALVAGDEVVFEASGNVFTLSYPGNSISWTDSGGVVPTGTQCRYVGWGLYRLLGFNSSTIDSWVGKDFL